MDADSGKMHYKILFSSQFVFKNVQRKLVSNLNITCLCVVIGTTIANICRCVSAECVRIYIPSGIMVKDSQPTRKMGQIMCIQVLFRLCVHIRKRVRKLVFCVQI